MEDVWRLIGRGLDVESKVAACLTCKTVRDAFRDDLRFAALVFAVKKRMEYVRARIRDAMDRVRVNETIRLHVTRDIVCVVRKFDTRPLFATSACVTFGWDLHGLRDPLTFRIIGTVTYHLGNNGWYRLESSLGNSVRMTLTGDSYAKARRMFAYCSGCLATVP